jgi:hypothetical protein
MAESSQPTARGMPPAEGVNSPRIARFTRGSRGANTEAVSARGTIRPGLGLVERVKGRSSARPLQLGSADAAGPRGRLAQQGCDLVVAAASGLGKRRGTAHALGVRAGARVEQHAHERYVTIPRGANQKRFAVAVIPDVCVRAQTNERGGHRRFSHVQKRSEAEAIARVWIRPTTHGTLECRYVRS